MTVPHKAEVILICSQLGTDVMRAGGQLVEGTFSVLRKSSITRSITIRNQNADGRLNARAKTQTLANPFRERLPPSRASPLVSRQCRLERLVSSRACKTLDTPREERNTNAKEPAEAKWGGIRDSCLHSATVGMIRRNFYRQRSK